MQNKMPPVHPGEILREELESLNLSARAFAKSLDVPTNRITEILNEKRSGGCQFSIPSDHYHKKYLPVV